LNKNIFQFWKEDLTSGIVVFLVSLPLCLGIAIASGAPLVSGLVSGIIGGIFIGILSKSHTSVSGPSAGNSAFVLAAVSTLGSFEIFLSVLVLSGGFQILMGLLRLGNLAYFFPSSVLKGVLAAIGIILVLKQIPHALGSDSDFEGDFYFSSKDDSNTFTEIINSFQDIHSGALAIFLVSFLMIILWDRFKLFDKIKLPAPLMAVILGILIQKGLFLYGGEFALRDDQFVVLPNIKDLTNFLHFVDFSQIHQLELWLLALTLSLITSLESLLTIEAVDKLDPHKRNTPNNHELVVQGMGNIFSGLIGGLPVTAVIVRGSAAIQAGGQTKLTTITHGFALLISVIFLGNFLNLIPLSALAAVLIMMGYKLATPEIFKSIYEKGWSQFLPFCVTILAILFTDLIQGISIGLVIGIFYLLKKNAKNTYHIIDEKYYHDNTLRIVIPQVASFLSKSNIRQILEGIKPGSKVIIDATNSEYIDPDVLEIIQDFVNTTSIGNNITTSVIGFKEKYEIEDNVRHIQVLTKELQESLTPEDTLKILKEGNKRFILGNPIDRDLIFQINATTTGQYPIAVVLSCIDSRTSSEIIFDMGLGDIFSVRVAGNIINTDILGSMEYACKVAGARLIVILGHSECGAVKSACDGVKLGNITDLLRKLDNPIQRETVTIQNRTSSNQLFVRNVTHLNIHNTMEGVLEGSPILKKMIETGEVGLVGGIHELSTGVVEFTKLYKVDQPPAVSMEINIDV
jgi:MFS superfamily sulfate permease-like transporter/carbonic anhydrase